MASSVTMMSPSSFFSRTLLRPSPDSLPKLKNSVPRVLMLSVKCLSEPNHDAKPEPGNKSGASISTYRWCSALGGLGFIETTYLSYLKLTDSVAFCPAGGGSCGDVLNSDYAVVFGVPLPLIGMFAYGLVAFLGLQLAAKKLPFGIRQTNGRLLLLGSTTAMAASSAYFSYILSTKFAGVSCSYCVFSIILTSSLFFITMKDFRLPELQKTAVLQLCIVSFMVATLSTSYIISPPASPSLAEIGIQPFTTEITTESSPLAVSLARHLHTVGAKMYGAFWCSHCIEQKQMFGRDAAKLLDYVECFPNGYNKGVKIEKACADAGIEGFPTWLINGQVLSGEQELAELARVSNFNMVDPEKKSF